MSSSSMLSSSSSSVVQYSDIQKHGGNKEFSCPSGFKFSPNDRQLVTHYLKNKIMDVSEPANLIKEFEFQNINPDQIPMDKVRYGKKNEVFYFTSKEWRGSKTSDGHWEATGEDEKILDGDEVVGFKKVFIFLWRKELIETKSQWVMQEYRINPSICSGSVNGDDDKDMIAKVVYHEFLF
ncbi:NAC domain [Macleaya cordata]|uniref:NAC domain n=1 Tax=Macleaya cordata TaxID=56857 RepID=A0A200QBQ1_MACCD|nr:NAC domain [Macleaya cordata]